MSLPTPTNQAPQHGKEPWRLRRVARAQPHLDEKAGLPLWVWVVAGVGILGLAIGVSILMFVRPSFLFSELTPTTQPTQPVATATPLVTPTLIVTATLVPTRTATPLPPTLTPTATATRPRPTATPVRYRVRFGDTLVSIAERYHISVQALMAANGLRNDLIRVGQELIIPIATPQP